MYGCGGGGGAMCTSESVTTFTLVTSIMNLSLINDEFKVISHTSQNKIVSPLFKFHKNKRKMTGNSFVFSNILYNSKQNAVS